MPCERIQLDGSTGFLCARTKPGKCIVCGESAAYLCDGPDAQDEDGVCSAEICAAVSPVTSSA